VGEAAPARYDAAYYAHGCGDRPYARDEVWLGFFGDVADRIVADIAPRTVLDAGCAMGFLVETLHERGIEAWGVDISKYAIEQVHESVGDFCAVGSILEPFEQRFDLITCIEVLEHLDAADGAKAIANLCAATDDVLFSSTPEDFREPTHENVQPPDYWAAAFARHGFYRDVDFDGSFLTPWAVRFRRHEGPIAPVIAAYERALWWLKQENAQRREAVAESEREGLELRALRERVAGMEAELVRVGEEAARLRGERDAAVGEARASEAREASGWGPRLVRLLRRR
jgi:2-polyprenyl-3-methyl-5-hydroxy-6-metoxy-1,4-benzoquinol methylase